MHTWEEGDVRKILDTFNYQSVLSKAGDRGLCIVKKNLNEPLLPCNAQVVSTHQVDKKFISDEKVRR